MIRPIVLCKAPRPGAVKTRLQPCFSPEQAANIHAAMARTFIANIARLFPFAWIAADDASDPFFSGFDLSVVSQGEGDLGERMARLLNLAISQGATGVLFTGTDSPHMSDARLLAAMRSLVCNDVVIGAVEDGGYDLIGIRGAHEGVFADIPWSTAEVVDATLCRLHELGLRYRLLSTGFDVDTPNDLTRLLRAGFRLPSSLRDILKSGGNFLAE